MWIIVVVITVLVLLFIWGNNENKKDKALADKGDPKALYNVGRVEESAKKGYVEAQYALGKKLKKENLEKAFEWFEKAAEQDNKDAIYEVGVSYLYGLGTVRYTDRGKKYLQISAEKHSNKLAALHLALLALENEQDKEAENWLQKSPGDWKRTIGKSGREVVIAAVAIRALYENGFSIYDKGKLEEHTQGRRENAFSLSIHREDYPGLTHLHFGDPESTQNSIMRSIFNPNESMACVLYDGWVYATAPYTKGSFGKVDIPHSLSVIAGTSVTAQIVRDLRDYSFNG